jgi:hypothetical protein
MSANRTDISTLESHLWEAANILRGGPLDRADWKSYILSLLFFKRICDVWDEEYAETLTELIQQTRSADTPILVERIVDDIVRMVRFDGWQATNAGEREIRKVLRRTLVKCKLHADSELFEKSLWVSYGYVKEYY